MTTDADLNLDELVFLDFDHVPPCEHRQHSGDQPASWHLTGVCPLCAHQVNALVCSKCRAIVDQAHRLTDAGGCRRVASRWMWELDFRRLE